MKKYHQLLLLVTSIVSLSLFLVYRHEYNRLHYVLEVFNFFGQPCNFSELQQTEHLLGLYDWGPSPSWQESGKSYIYSAFLKKSELKALAVSDSGNVPKNCYVWFEDEAKPTIGQFKYTKITDRKSTEYNAYFYICTFKKPEIEPYAVSFSDKLQQFSLMKKIIINQFKNYTAKINTTVCVSPSIFNKKQFVEFLSYHKLIGIKYFIIYNNDIPYRLAKLITNLANRLDLYTSFLTWNYPMEGNEIIRAIVKNDCILRSLGTSKNVITLDVSEYIVPFNSYDLETTLGTANSNKIDMPVQTFCIGNNASTKPISMQNVNVIIDKNLNIRTIYVDTDKDKTSYNGGERVKAVIHKYVDCPKQPVKTIVDTSILKYSTDLSRSTLVQLLKHNQL